MLDLSSTCRGIRRFYFFLIFFFKFMLVIVLERGRKWQLKGKIAFNFTGSTKHLLKRSNKAHGFGKCFERVRAGQRFAFLEQYLRDHFMTALVRNDSRHG